MISCMETDEVPRARRHPQNLFVVVRFVHCTLFIFRKMTFYETVNF